MADSIGKIKIEDAKIWKILGTYELQLCLKKKGFFGSSEIDNTKIRLNELSSKCICEKKIKLDKFNVVMKLRVRQPFRNPEIEEVPVFKYRIDQYPAPFRQIDQQIESKAALV